MLLVATRKYKVALHEQRILKEAMAGSQGDGFISEAQVAVLVVKATGETDVIDN